MKNILTMLSAILKVGMAIAIALFVFTLSYSALATDISSGSKIFGNNCASCHLGGGNILISEKSLQKEALSKYLENYHTDAVSAIIYNVKNGKNAMPAFKSKLSEQEILEVAAYVFQKSEQSWDKSQEPIVGGQNPVN